MFDLGGLLGNRGFHRELTDRSLVLSWRTDRIPQSDLAVYESRLQHAIGATGAVPP